MAMSKFGREIPQARLIRKLDGDSRRLSGGLDYNVRKEKPYSGHKKVYDSEVHYIHRDAQQSVVIHPVDMNNWSFLIPLPLRLDRCGWVITRAD
jgi:hypothetical protein